MWLRAYEAEHDRQDKRFATVDNLWVLHIYVIVSRV